MNNSTTTEAEGFIEYRGDAEPLDAWVDSLAEYEVELISDGLRGWGEYTRLVKLTSSDSGGEYHLFYLVTDEAAPYVTTS